MCPITRLSQYYFLFLQNLQNTKRSIFNFLACLPTSLLALILLLLLLYNGSSVFYIHLPSPTKYPSGSPTFPPAVKSLKKVSSSVLYAVKEENPLRTRLPLLQKPAFSMIPIDNSSSLRRKKAKKLKALIRVLCQGGKSKQFSTRLSIFLETSVCKVRFFMTWISSLDSFGDREKFTIESLFKFHPNACLIILSNSMDSEKGNNVLKPFLDMGFKVIAISPDFDDILKKTPAETWFEQIKTGRVHPGSVSFGQNLSNLLRLVLLYKYGGIYIDTDFVILKSLNKLNNCIGAQNVDTETGNWNRLNNAILVFDKKHPLLLKFIEEFAASFNGNKWGHNGPYLVSRVVSRIDRRVGLNFTVLSPSAFYPVDWRRITSLFRAPRDGLHSKWLNRKIEQIRKDSFAVHLWNKQSRQIKVENGSVINHLMLDSCIFCNFSSLNLLKNSQR